MNYACTYYKANDWETTEVIQNFKYRHVFVEYINGKQLRNSPTPSPKLNEQPENFRIR